MTGGAKKGWSCLPAALWMSVIFLLSSRPKLPTASFDADLVAIAGHVIVYGVLALALAWGLRREGVVGRRLFVLALFGAVAYGVTDELHQSFVPGRHADPVDLLLDAFGAAAALLVAHSLLRRGKQGRAPIQRVTSA